MSQLFMRKPDLTDLPEIKMPAGYEMRTYLPGDGPAWSRIMGKTIGGDTDPGRFDREIRDKPQFSPDRVFFVTCGGEVVGSATAWEQPAGNRETGYVHMVGVLPEHRGRGLGYQLSLRTLHWFRDHGFREAVLHTDDFRVAAIRVYLKLGFVPEFTDETHPKRWKKIADETGFDIPGVR